MDGTGVPIYAFADGTVSYVQNSSGNWSPDEPDLFPDSSIQTFGNMVAINHTNPHTGKVSGAYARTIYAHMRDNPTLRVGSAIKKGAVVGYMGNTGRSSGTPSFLSYGFQSV